MAGRARRSALGPGCAHRYRPGRPVRTARRSSRVWLASFAPRPAGAVREGWQAGPTGGGGSGARGAGLIAVGLGLFSLGTIGALYVGQGVMVGLLGSGGLFPPLPVYVSRWFDRRRGTAIALISSGQ